MIFSAENLFSCCPMTCLAWKQHLEGRIALKIPGRSFLPEFLTFQALSIFSPLNFPKKKLFHIHWELNCQSAYIVARNLFVLFSWLLLTKKFSELKPSCMGKPFRQHDWSIFTASRFRGRFRAAISKINVLRCWVWLFLIPKWDCQWVCVIHCSWDRNTCGGHL